MHAAATSSCHGFAVCNKSRIVPGGFRTKVEAHGVELHSLVEE